MVDRAHSSKLWSREREVEQPFARIVDNVDVQPVLAETTLHEAARVEFHRKPQLCQLPGAVGPCRGLAQQVLEMAFVVETRHCIVGLGL